MYSTDKVIIPLASITLFIILVGVISQNTFAGRVFSKLTGVNLVSTKAYVVINDEKIFVDIADSPREWQLGLSGKKSLGKNEGMLFIMDPPDSNPSFWMEGMLFDLDIIWINDERIVQMDLGVEKPDKGISSSQLPLYKPLVGVDYVLEVNSGFVKEEEFAVGDSVDFSHLQSE
jgi:uncharacterized membrane protein (UPF0127 family)